MFSDLFQLDAPDDDVLNRSAAMLDDDVSEEDEDDSELMQVRKDLPTCRLKS